MFKTKLQDLMFVLVCFLPWSNLLSIWAHSCLLECEGVFCAIALEINCMFSEFTICGILDIALTVRGDFRILNSVGAPKDYEDHSRLNVFLP